MVHTNRKKALSWLLTLAMLLSLLPGMSLTARAAAEVTDSSAAETWSEDQIVNGDNVRLDGGVTVTADVTLTIPAGKKLTVNGGIDATGKTLTVTGEGTLIVNGTKGSDKAEDTDEDGDDGGAGFTGDLIIDGASVTVTGGNGGKGSSFYFLGNNPGNGGVGGAGVAGSVVLKSGIAAVTGGNGGAGGSYYGGKPGGDGGDGGAGVADSLTVNGGSIVVTGGTGGLGGHNTDIYSNITGTPGETAKAVAGTITAEDAQESGDNAQWSAVSGNASGKQYIRVGVPATLTSNITVWDRDFTVAEDVEFSGGVTVTNNITLTIPADRTVTVNNGINATGKTLTVTGEGTLIVNGAKGVDGNEQQDEGGKGGDGYKGNLTVDGAVVRVTGGAGGIGDGTSDSGGGGAGMVGNLTVTSGSATVTGCSGTDAAMASTAGGNGVTGSVNVSGGSVNVTGGNAGNANDGCVIGGPGGHGVTGSLTVSDGSVIVSGGSGGQGDDENGPAGTAVRGTITGPSVRHSSDGTVWNDMASGTTSSLRYVEVTTPKAAEWSTDQHFTESAQFDIGVLVTADITVTIDKDVTVTVKGGIDATGHSMTAAGEGKLIVNGAKGSDKARDAVEDGDDGGAGFTGDIIIDGASVTVTGGNGGKGSGTYQKVNQTGNGGVGGAGVAGSVTLKSGIAAVTGGNGGEGGSDYGDNPGAGGNGGAGVADSLTVNGGSIVVNGGTGGLGGQDYMGRRTAAPGENAKAVAGTITAGDAQESGDNAQWSAVSGNASDKQYIRVGVPATLTSNITVWDRDFTVAEDVEFSGGVTVTNNITLTIPAGRTVTVNNGINGTGKTLTVTGEGTLIVNGAKGVDGNEQQREGGVGGVGYRGNLIVDGAVISVTGGAGGKGVGSAASGGGGAGMVGNLTVTSGTATVTGCSGTDAALTGPGGNGVTGSVNVSGGIVTVTGGNGGNTSVVGSNGGHGVTGSLTVSDGSVIVSGGSGVKSGSAGTAVRGTITAPSAQHSDNNIDWSAISGTTSTKQYVKTHKHILTEYAADGAAITAICTSESCPAPETDGRHIVTLTIAAPTEGGGAAVLTGAADFGVTDADVEYSGDSGVSWSSAVPEGDGFYQARVRVTDGNTPANTYTASVKYGVNAIHTDKAYTHETDHGTVAVPTVATVNADVTIQTTLATGYEIGGLTVTKESGGTVPVTLDGSNGSFTMPDDDVTVSASFQKINYTVSFSEMSNGSVSASKDGSPVSETNPANYGDTITLTGSPDTGFALLTITVKDGGNKDVTLSGEGDTRTFTMPASGVTVSATFEGQPFAVTLAADPADGGTVEAAGPGVATVENVTTAKAGTEVTVTATPGAGFDFDSFTVTRAGGGDVALTGEGSARTFTMPAEAVTVTAGFAGHAANVNLQVAGDGGETCGAALLDSSFRELGSTAETRMGDKVILRVTSREDCDYTVALDPANQASKYMTLFTVEEYARYIDYVRANGISATDPTYLYWLTVPGMDQDDLNVTVTFGKAKTFTILYRAAGTQEPGEVLCSFTRDAGAAAAKNTTVKMKRDASLGDETVWSVKVQAGFVPSQVAFVETDQSMNDQEAAEAFVGAEMNTVPSNTSSLNWQDSANGGDFSVIGGNAKTVIAAFVTDSSGLAVYHNDTASVDPAENDRGVTYQIAVCGIDRNGNVTNAGTVTTPAAPTAPQGKEFAGWRVILGGSKPFVQVFGANEEIDSVTRNSIFLAVWKPVQLTVTLDRNGGTGGSNVTSAAYGSRLSIPENPTREGCVFDHWAVQKSVTESGRLFVRDAAFDFDTPLTADLKLMAVWKHVHTYTPHQISEFKALKKYESYGDKLHVSLCGCYDLSIEPHSFNSNGVCACGYVKPVPGKVTLNVSYGKWSNGTYTERMAELPEQVGRNQEVSLYAPDTWGDLKFSKWEYSTNNGATWRDLTADAMTSFLIPANMQVRALYINDTKKPQVLLTTQDYTQEAEGYTWQNKIFHMSYKLPDGYTLLDGGVRLGDNNGISYYEMRERKYTMDAEATAITVSLVAVETILASDYENVTAIEYSATETYYAERENSVLDEIDAKHLSDLMFESTPYNVDKYEPIYWDYVLNTKGLSGSINALVPLRFIQKNNGDHYIYGIGFIKYKTPDGQVNTIYTDALPTTLNEASGKTVLKNGD